MTEYLNTVTNPAAPWSSISDTEENILHDLARYALDPMFELYGNFINPTPEYQAARQKMLAKLPALTKQSAHVGRAYAWPGGWLRLTRVYRLTEQEANDNALLYLDRWEGSDHNGMIHGAAFHDGDQLPTTANWKL